MRAVYTALSLRDGRHVLNLKRLQADLAKKTVLGTFHSQELCSVHKDHHPNAILVPPLVC